MTSTNFASPESSLMSGLSPSKYLPTGSSPNREEQCTVCVALMANVGIGYIKKMISERYTKDERTRKI